MKSTADHALWATLEMQTSLIEELDAGTGGSRRAALDFAAQCGFGVTSMLDRDATVNQFSGSSPGEVR
jgi:hypothetical protein